MIMQCCITKSIPRRLILEIKTQRVKEEEEKKNRPRAGPPRIIRHPISVDLSDAFIANRRRIFFLYIYCVREWCRIMKKKKKFLSRGRFKTMVKEKKKKIIFQEVQLLFLYSRRIFYVLININYRQIN